MKTANFACPKQDVEMTYSKASIELDKQLKEKGFTPYPAQPYIYSNREGVVIWTDKSSYRESDDWKWHSMPFKYQIR